MDVTSRVAKFVDCRSRDVSEREIFIVEGDSALGACKQARDPDFQAIMPIRGKILNCLKADYDKIFKSDIITDSDQGARLRRAGQIEGQPRSLLL